MSLDIHQKEDKPAEKKAPAKMLTIVFNIAKNELGHPSKNLRKIVKHLKDSGRAKCVLFKEEIVYEKIKKADVIMFNAPTQKFRGTELKA